MVCFVTECDETFVHSCWSTYQWWLCVQTPPTADEAGYCHHVRVDEIGDTPVVIFKQGTYGNTAITSNTAVVILSYIYLYPMPKAVAGFHQHLFVFLSTWLLKTDAARITKLDIEMFHTESWRPIYFAVKRSKSQDTNIAGMIMALLWVLSFLFLFFCFIICPFMAVANECCQVHVY